MIKRHGAWRHSSEQLKDALLRANGKSVVVDGQERTLRCREVNGAWFCDAEITHPKTPDEAKFCLMDLWRSESDIAFKFIETFAQLGGYDYAKGIPVEEAAAVPAKPLTPRAAVSLALAFISKDQMYHAIVNHPHQPPISLGEALEASLAAPEKKRDNTIDTKVERPEVAKPLDGRGQGQAVRGAIYAALGPCHITFSSIYHDYFALAVAFNQPDKRIGDKVSAAVAGCLPDWRRIETSVHTYRNQIVVNCYAKDKLTTGDNPS